MKKALFLALLAGLSTALFSQQTYRVISENGLKLRASPNKTGAFLGVAPF